MDELSLEEVLKNFSQYGRKRNPKLFEKQRKEMLIQFENAQEEIEKLTQGMEKSQKLTNEMVLIFENLENRIDELENEIEPIHKETTRLRLLYQNVEETEKYSSLILGYFETFEQARVVVEGGIRDSLAPFDQALQNVANAIDFLQLNSQLKGAEKALLQLKSLRQTGIQEYEKKFISILTNHCHVIDLSLPHDSKERETIGPTQLLQQNQEKEFELIKPELIGELKQLIDRFHSFNHLNYLKDLVEKRSKILLGSVKKLVPERITKEDGSVKRSHAYINAIFMLLRLLKAEKQFCDDLLDSQYAANTLGEIISESFDLFFETGELIMKIKRNSEKGFGMYPLMDIWEVLRETLPQFELLLGRENAKIFQTLSELTNSMGLSVLKCSEEFSQYVRSDHSIKHLPLDGTVHEVTSNACLFLRRIDEYKPTLEILLPTPQSKGPVLSELIGRALVDLKANLIAASKKEKRTSLATIFLLNNFHYIYNTIKKSEIWSLVPNQSQFSTGYEKDINEQRDIYKASWRNPLRFITIDEKLSGITGAEKKLASKEKKIIKERFEKFNEQLEDLFNTQKMYYITDSELRTLVKSDLRKLLVEPYDVFYKKFSKLPFSENKGKYVRYDPNTIETMIQKFFEGQVVQQEKSSKLFHL